MKTRRLLKSLFLFALSALLIIGATGCELFGKIKTSNGVQIDKKASAKEFLEAVIENTSLEYQNDVTKKATELYNKLLDGGALELSAKADALGVENISAYLSFDKDSNCSLNLSAGELANIQGFVNKEELAFKLNANFGGAEISGAYGLNVKDAKENLGKSIFAPGSGSNFELPNEVFETLNKLIDLFSAESITKLEKELEATLKAIVEDAETKFALTKVDNSDKTYDIKCVITPEAFADFIKNCAKKIDANKVITDFVKNYTEITDLEFDTFESLVEDIDDTIDEDDKPLNLSIHITEDYLVESVTIEEEGDEKNKLVINIEKVDDGYKATMAVSDNKLTFTQTLSKDGLYIEFKADELTYKIDWNYGTDGAFSINMEAEGQTVEMKGTATIADDKFEIKITEVTVDGEKTEIEIVATIYADIDESKTAKEFEYTDLLKLTEEDIQSLIALISSLDQGTNIDPNPIIGDGDWPGDYLGIPEPNFGEGYCFSEELDEENDLFYVYEPISEEAASAYATTLNELEFSFLEDESVATGMIVYKIDEGVHLVFGNYGDDEIQTGFVIITIRDLDSVFDDWFSEEAE